EKAATAVHASEQQRRQSQWEQIRPRYEGQFDSAMIVAEMRGKRAKNGSRGDRYREAQRRAGGVYIQPTNALASTHVVPSGPLVANALAR
ncbi:MAG TPA: hypothetical protein VFF48_06495, partial [Brevundimonas sp.]|nr:hypothetical protein [Brevundimonas sp.]